MRTIKTTRIGIVIASLVILRGLPAYCEESQGQPKPTLQKDMGRSEFDANQMLKYTVNPVTGNVVVRISQISVPSQRGPALNAILTYNSQIEKQEDFPEPPFIFGDQWIFSYSKVLYHEPFHLCTDTGDWEYLEISAGDLLKEDPEWPYPDDYAYCCNWPPQDSCGSEWELITECCREQWPPSCCNEVPECCPEMWRASHEWPPLCCGDLPECCNEHPEDLPCCSQPGNPDYCQSYWDGTCDQYYECLDETCYPRAVEMYGAWCRTECQGHISDNEECYALCLDGCLLDDPYEYWSGCIQDDCQDMITGWDDCALSREPPEPPPYGAAEPIECETWYPNACVANGMDPDPCSGFSNGCEYSLLQDGKDYDPRMCDRYLVCELEGYIGYPCESDCPCEYLPNSPFTDCADCGLGGCSCRGEGGYDWADCSPCDWDYACGANSEWCQYDCGLQDLYGDCSYCNWDNCYGDSLDYDPCHPNEGNFEPVTGYLFYDGEGDGQFVLDTLSLPEQNPYHYAIDEGSIRLKDGTTYLFDDDNHIESITDRFGNSLTIHCAGSEKPDLITDATGRTLTISYYGDGLVQTITDPSGRVFEYHYDGGRLKEIVDPEEEVTKFSYQTYTGGGIRPRSLLVKIEYPEGNTVNFDYEVGRVDTKVKFKCIRAWKTESEGIEDHSYEYIVLGPNGTTVITDSLGNSIAQTFTKSGMRYYDKTMFETSLVTKIEDYYGETQYDFDELHQLVETIDTNNLVYSMTYDDLGNMLTKIADPGARGLNYATTFTYETEFSEITSITDPNFHTKHMYYGNPEYGTSGTLWKEVDAEGYETLHWYNEYGQRIKTQDARGSVTLFGYGHWGLLTSVTQVTAMGLYTTSFSYDTNGNKIQEINANGIVTTHEYDFLNRLNKTSVYDEGGPFETLYEYDGNGNVTAKIDPNGNRTDYVYDSADRLTDVMEPEGRYSHYEYDKESNKAWETDPNGNRTDYIYDEIYRLIREIKYLDTKEVPTIYEYGGSGDNSTQNGDARYSRKKDKYTRKIDANAHSTYYAYDKLYRLTEEKDHLQCYLTYQYDPAGKKSAEKDKNGNWTHFTYNPRNLLVEISDPYTNTVAYQFDGAGNKTAEKDKRGKWTAFSYDERNLLLQTTDALGNSIVCEYDGVGNKTRETDKRENPTDFGYNGRNLVVETTQHLEGVDIVSTLGYDANGNKLIETDPNGNSNRYAYDGLNRLISKTDALWNATTYVYDPNGNRRYITDANGNETEYRYDELNRLEEVEDALGNVTYYLYDAVGNKRFITDAENHTTEYIYDEVNRLEKVIDPVGNETSYDYDCNGNRIWQQNGNSQVINYVYDDLNRLEKRLFPGGAEVGYSYDQNGNRLSMTDAGGVTTYYYDVLNRLDWTTATSNKTISYSYDENSNRTGITAPSAGETVYVYDDLNRVERIEDPIAVEETSYIYDSGGRIVQMTYPNGAFAAFSYTENNWILGQVTKTSDEQNVITSFDYTYDNVGNRLTMTDLQGTTTYQYDDLYRLVTADYPDDSWSTYSYDKVGNRISWSNASGTVAYQHNGANELTYLSNNYTSGTVNVFGGLSDLDEYGNPAQVVSVKVNGIAAEVSFDSFSAFNVPIELGFNTLTAVATDSGGKTSWSEVTINVTKTGEDFTNFKYDGNGNLVEKNKQGDVTAYYYDVENRLTKVRLPNGQTNEFTYDGDKRRVSSKSANGTVTRYLFDGLNVLQDLDVFGNIKASYLQGIGIDKLIARSDWESQTVSSIGFYHSDALGSVRSLTNSDEEVTAGYSYDAWGRLTAQTGSSGNRYGFTSREWEDEIGLQFNRARFYDPEIGRFITRDPLTGSPDDPTISYFSGVYSQFHRFIKGYVDALQPHRHNRYAYCYNNPVNLVDPLGLVPDEGEVEKAGERSDWSKQVGITESQASTTGTEQPGMDAEDMKEAEGLNTKQDISQNERDIRDESSNIKSGKQVLKNTDINSDTKFGFKDATKVVWEIVKHQVRALFEGSQLGGGVGRKLQFELGPLLKVEAVSHSITGQRIEANGIKPFQEEKSEFSLQVGPWKPTLSHSGETGLKGSPVSFEINRISTNNLSIIFGGTFPIPCGAAINAELHINLGAYFE